MNTTTIKQYNLSEYEMRIIDQCLRYALHRLNAHPDCGLRKSRIKSSQISKLIKDYEKEQFKEFDAELDKISGAF